MNVHIYKINLLQREIQGARFWTPSSSFHFSPKIPETPPLLERGKKNNFDSGIRGFGRQELPTITSRNSKSWFDQLNLEQNNPKKKILMSSVARNSQKCTKMDLELFSKFCKKEIKNMKNVYHQVTGTIGY